MKNTKYSNCLSGKANDSNQKSSVEETVVVKQSMDFLLTQL